MPTHLWQRLRQARRYAGITQQALAKQCGVSRAAVALWESAEPEHRTRPTSEHCVAIARACGVPIEWLLNDASDLNTIWQQGSAPAMGSTDVLPDLRQDGQSFFFATTPEQIARKMEAIRQEPPGSAHLIVVGVDAQVSSAATPTEALASVVKSLTKK